jgi:hypothetical protein
MGCKNACAFTMDGLEGMRTVVDTQWAGGAEVPFSVTETAGAEINGALVEQTLNLTTEYFNGGRTPNDQSQCGSPCELRPKLISTAIASEKAVQARGIETEHVAPH